MNYHVKNVKSFEGMEGYGFNATLYRDKKRVAKVIDEGNGGPKIFRWYDTDAEKIEATVTTPEGKQTTVKRTPEEHAYIEHAKETENASVDFAHELLISRLVDDYENNQRLKRHCQNKTLVKFKSDAEGELRVYNVRFCKEVKDKIVEKFGDDVEEFINERFAG